MQCCPPIAKAGSSYVVQYKRGGAQVQPHSQIQRRKGRVMIQARVIYTIKLGGNENWVVTRLLNKGTRSIMLGMSGYFIKTLPAVATATGTVQFTGHEIAFAGGIAVAALGGLFSIFQKLFTDFRDQDRIEKANNRHQQFLENEAQMTKQTSEVSSEFTKEQRDQLSVEFNQMTVQRNSYKEAAKTADGAEAKVHDTVITSMEVKEVQTKAEELNLAFKKDQEKKAKNGTDEAIPVKSDGETGAISQTEGQIVTNLGGEEEKEKSEVLEGNGAPDVEEGVQVVKERLFSKEELDGSVVSDVKAELEEESSITSSESFEEKSIELVESEEVLTESKTAQHETLLSPKEQQVGTIEAESETIIQSEEVEESQVEPVQEVETTLETVVNQVKQKAESQPDVPTVEGESKDNGDSVVKIKYASGWPKAILHGSINGGTWSDISGNHVSPGESVFEIDTSSTVLNETAPLLEFVFTDGEGDWDNPQVGENYFIKAPGNYTIKDGVVNADKE